MILRETHIIPSGLIKNIPKPIIISLLRSFSVRNSSVRKVSEQLYPARKRLGRLKQAAAGKEAVFFIQLLGTKGNVCPSVFV